MRIKITDGCGFYSDGEIYETLGGKEPDLYGRGFGYFVKHPSNETAMECAFVYEQHCVNIANEATQNEEEIDGQDAV